MRIMPIGFSLIFVLMITSCNSREGSSQATSSQSNLFFQPSEPGQEEVIPEPGPFHVVSVFPDDMAQNVSYRTNIEITFNKIPDPASIDTATFSVTNNAVEVAGQLSFDSNAKLLIFDPDTMLLMGETYTVSLSGNISVRDGESLGREFISYFSTFVPYEVGVIENDIRSWFGLAASDGVLYIDSPAGILTYQVGPGDTIQAIGVIPTLLYNSSARLRADNGKLFRDSVKEKRSTCALDGCTYIIIFEGWDMSNINNPISIGEIISARFVPAGGVAPPVIFRATPRIRIVLDGDSVVFAFQDNRAIFTYYFADMNNLLNYSIFNSFIFSDFIACDQTDKLVFSLAGSSVDVYSIGPPHSVASPQLLSSISAYYNNNPSYPYVRDAESGSGLIYLLRSDDTLMIVDLGNPLLPNTLSELNFSVSILMMIEIEDNLAVMGGSALAIADLTDPYSPTELYSEVPGFFFWEMTIDGDFAFFRDSSSKVHVYRISPP